MSTAPLSDAQIKALGEQYGVDEQRARFLLGVRDQQPRVAVVEAVERVAPVLTFPVRIVLPWSALCSDNERECPSLTKRHGETVPIMVKTSRFKSAREAVRTIARLAMAGAKPATQPLALVGKLYTPTQRRVDATNFAKGVQDALSKIVYVDDAQLQDVRWVKVAMDIDHPRAEIEIRPL